MKEYLKCFNANMLKGQIFIFIIVLLIFCFLIAALLNNNKIKLLPLVTYSNVCVLTIKQIPAFTLCKTSQTNLDINTPTLKSK